MEARGPNLNSTYIASDRFCLTLIAGVYVEYCMYVASQGRTCVKARFIGVPWAAFRRTKSSSDPDVATLN